jgi:hypothetical protein
LRDAGDDARLTLSSDEIATLDALTTDEAVATWCVVARVSPACARASQPHATRALAGCAAPPPPCAAPSDGGVVIHSARDARCGRSWWSMMMRPHVRARASRHAHYLKRRAGTSAPWGDGPRPRLAGPLPPPPPPPAATAASASATEPPAAAAAVCESAGGEGAASS